MSQAPAIQTGSEISPTVHTARLAHTSLRVGTSIIVQRDETRYPSKGTWPQFRGKTGAVIEINRAGRGATEYGIAFGKVQRVAAWFKAHELVAQ
jgi:hypothetical protein